MSLKCSIKQRKSLLKLTRIAGCVKIRPVKQKLGRLYKYESTSPGGAKALSGYLFILQGNVRHIVGLSPTKITSVSAKPLPEPFIYLVAGG